MREIKFRAWDDVQKKMFYDVGLLGGELYVNIDGKGYDVVGDCGDFKLMQFTRLYDRKGTPIYEGDIVRVWGGESYYGAYYLEVEDIRYSLFEILEGENVEVLGNRFENPELLEGVK